MQYNFVGINGQKVSSTSSKMGMSNPANGVSPHQMNILDENIDKGLVNRD